VNSGHIARHLKCADLYNRITRGEYTSETELRGLLDAIYHSGKIDGYLSAVKPPVFPQAGEQWHRRDNPADTVTIETIGHSAGGHIHVFYLHNDPDACPCASPEDGVHARRGHASRMLLGDFRQAYVGSPQADDRLIARSQRIIDSVQ
jgi:hypothetical protein